jgi:serine/threonine protein kinase
MGFSTGSPYCTRWSSWNEILAFDQNDSQVSFSFELKPNHCYRDLKSHNLLVNAQFCCKISDFGTSRYLDSAKGMTANTGTPAWIAPEVHESEHYSEKADVYSFGVGMHSDYRYILVG